MHIKIGDSDSLPEFSKLKMKTVTENERQKVTRVFLKITFTKYYCSHNCPTFLRTKNTLAPGQWTINFTI